MLCVRPGVLDVRARPLRKSREFIREDLPTFDLPRKATSGRPSEIQCDGSNALFTNSAEVIFNSQKAPERCRDSFPRGLFERRGDIGRRPVRIPNYRWFDRQFRFFRLDREFQHFVYRVDNVNRQVLPNLFGNVSKVLFVFLG